MADTETIVLEIMPDLGTLTKNCSAEFDRTQDYLENAGGNDSAALRDEKARFTTWLDTVAPNDSNGISDLDYQLRDNDDLRSWVRTLLEGIIGLLEQVRESSLDEDDSDSSDQEVDDDLDSQKTPQARNIARIRRVTDIMFRLSGSFKEPAPDDQLQADQMTEDESSHEVDVEQVTTQFPSVAPFLAERLGKAISKRRQYFIYRKRVFDDHKKDVSLLLNGQSESDLPGDNGVNGIRDSEPLRLPPGEEIEPCLPPLPKTGEFECPICYHEYNPIDKKFWDIHLEDDLSPYLCTYENCPSGPHQYRRRQDWQRHEYNAHYRIWRCPYECEITCLSATELSEHIQSKHGPSQDPEVLKTLVQACSRPLGSMQDPRCPLCQCHLSTLEKWYQHVGAHLRYLAYFSLPTHLVRVKSHQQDEGIRWVSSETLAELTEAEEEKAPEDASEAQFGAIQRRATVESEDSEKDDNNSSASEAEGRLEDIVLEGVVDDTVKEDGPARGRSQSPKERSDRSRDGSKERFLHQRRRHGRSLSRETSVEFIQREASPRASRLESEEIVVAHVRKGSSGKQEFKEYHTIPRTRDDETGDAPPQRNEASREREMSPVPESPDQGNDKGRQPVNEEIIVTRDKSGMERETRIRRQFKTAETEQVRDHVRPDHIISMHEEQKRAAERQRDELKAELKMEMEKKEREQKEFEERIKLDIKRRDAENKKKQDENELEFRNKMSKRLRDLGYTESQIRTLVSDEKADRPGPAFLREDYGEYYAPSRDRRPSPPPRQRMVDQPGEAYYNSHPITEYYAPSRGRRPSPPRHRAGDRSGDELEQENYLYGSAPRQHTHDHPSRPNFDPDEHEEPIRFEDAEGRRFKLPFKAARTWKGMQKMIREIYQGSELRDMDEDVLSGRYWILDADETGILPSSWEMTVKPGHFYILGFTRPKEPPADRGSEDLPRDADREYALYRRRRHSPSPARDADREFMEWELRRLQRERRDLSRERATRERERADAREREVIFEREPVRERDKLKEKERLPAINIYNRMNDSPVRAPPQRRDSQRKSGTKAVSFEPYVDEEPGWYPDLERATGGGFRRPARESEYRPRYRDDSQNVSYAYPPPPPGNDYPQGRRPTWVKVHRDYLDPDTLKYYDLPWAYDHNDPNFLIIQRDMDKRETDILFEHTRRLRQSSMPLLADRSSTRAETFYR